MPENGRLDLIRRLKVKWFKSCFAERHLGLSLGNWLTSSCVEIHLSFLRSCDVCVSCCFFVYLFRLLFYSASFCLIFSFLFSFLSPVIFSLLLLCLLRSFFFLSFGLSQNNVDFPVFLFFFCFTPLFLYRNTVKVFVFFPH